MTKIKENPEDSYEELIIKTSNDEILIEKKENNEHNKTNDNNKDHCKEEKVDEISKLYKRVTVSERIAEIIFYFNIVISAITIFEFKYQDLFFKINIISCILYVTLSNITDIYFKNIAENERRKGLIKHSFHVNITKRKTKMYYNNNEQESIRKMGIDCFENTFFTKFIVNKMMITESIKVFVIILIYIILLIEVTNTEFLVLITQTIFSSEYFFKFIKFCYFKLQVSRINEKFYDMFVLNPPNDENIMIVKILDASMDYECLKFYCKISLSSRVYKKYKDKLTDEWESLYHENIEIKHNNNNNKFIKNKD